MLTYNLQDRTIHITNGVDFVFPSIVRLYIELGPPEIFGVGRGPLSFVLKNTDYEVHFDANVGKTDIIPLEELNELEVDVRFTNASYSLKGNVLTYETEVSELSQIDDLAFSFSSIFQSLINIYYPSVPYVLKIYGELEETKFNWIYKGAKIPTRVSSEDLLKKCMVDVFVKSSIFYSDSNKRLLVSVYYLYHASRLLNVGISFWEFMPEAILNMCKSIEALFTNSRDEVREELGKLGYDAEIESVYIPLMLLRNELDVGHASLSDLDLSKLNRLYDFLIDVESHMKSLVINIVESIKDGKYELLPYTPNNDKNEILEEILESTGF